MKIVTLFATFVFLIASTTFAISQEDQLVKLLTDELDITKDQAIGGAGSLFNYSKESLIDEEFQKVSESVPDMKGYLNAVPSLDGGKKTGLLGQATQTLVGMPAVTAQFEKLGLSADMVGLFTPLLVDYVDKKGGEAVSGLLSKALSK